MLTVLIPTAARPMLLRMALQSVVGQTARAKIGRVVVSENGGDGSSRAVCEEFPQLPIAYHFREPALTPLGHGAVLMRECADRDFTAILHDDDWWLPHHVADALAAFDAHPEAAAYGANVIMLEDDVLKDGQCETFAWLGANYPAGSLWQLASVDVLLASLLGLVIRYSALVVRSEALRKSAFIYDLGNPFDNDRMLLFALSQSGPVLCNSNIGVGIRIHQNRDTSRFDHEERCRRMAQTTAWMVESSRTPWSRVATLFVQRLERCPSEEKKLYFLREAVTRHWCLPEIARHLDRTNDQAFFALYDQARAAFTGEKPPEDR